jgi:hypothetical protein
MKLSRMASFIVCLLFLNIVRAQGDVAEIVTFNPEGFVKGVRQVRVKFSEAMTAMGDPQDRLQPFIIDCPVKGSSKWEDSTNWVYDFEKDLPGGIRVAFKLRPGLKTLSGKAIKAAESYTLHWRPFYRQIPSL